ncbi:MAG: EFR1 family ferrodoxin [Thermoplasmatota archaeon]
MPRGIIFYYSSTGNTELACEYLRRRSSQTEFELHDMKSGKRDDLDAFEIVGFATFVDYMGPPKFFVDFVKGIRTSGGKPAFVLNTCASIPGRSLKTMSRMVESSGFEVLSGHTIFMPENLPYMRRRGIRNDGNPKEKEFASFNSFISDLDDLATSISLKGEVRKRPLKIGILNLLIPAFRRTRARKSMGGIWADDPACIECGKCVPICPYGAIRMDPKPVFDLSRCYGCYACYNICPADAIRTKKIQGGHHYRGPSQDLLRKLSY